MPSEVPGGFIFWAWGHRSTCWWLPRLPKVALEHEPRDFGASLTVPWETLSRGRRALGALGKGHRVLFGPLPLGTGFL